MTTVGPGRHAAFPVLMVDVNQSPLPRQRSRRAVGWLVGVAAENAAGAIYGTVIVGVLLAAEDTHREGYPQTIEATAVVLTLYWLLGLYTHLLGIRLRTRGRLSKALVWHSCAYELAKVEGGFIPVLALLIAWAAGASVTSGVAAALWATVASIVALELAAAWRTRMRRQSVWLQAAVGALAGLAIIALKLILH